MSETNCELCGLPMPPGETMFKFHGYSGPCPGPMLPKPTIREQLETAMTQLGYNLARDQYGYMVEASIHFAKGWHAARSSNEDGTVRVVKPTEPRP